LNASDRAIACACGIVVEGSIKPGSVAWTSHWKSRGNPSHHLCWQRSVARHVQDKSQALVEGRRVLTAGFVAEHVQAKCASSTKPLRVATSQPRPALLNEAACNAQSKSLGERRKHYDVFGSFTLLLAFVCAVYALVGGIAASITRHPLLVKSTRQAGMATCVLIFIATFSLEYLLLHDNFSQAMSSRSNRDLSAFYKVLRCGRPGRLVVVLELSALGLCDFRLMPSQ